MYFYIEVAHTQHRYLTSRDNKIVIHRIESGLLQQWKLVESGEEPFMYIKPVQNEGLVLASPAIQDLAEIVLVPFNPLANQDLAKWDVVPVDQRHGNQYPGANEHTGCVFIMLKSPLKGRGSATKSKEYELGAKGESTHNNTPVVLFHHQGWDVEEPRNQMWIIHT